MNFTIFTPTYNRQKQLGNVYNSIIAQNYPECEWVIMDDGSKDDTRQIVQEWIAENRICIKYYYQENQGRFAAYNNAIKYFEGDLVLLVDSDNYLLDGALRRLEDIWNRSNKNQVSGIISYMINELGDIYGTDFPSGINEERIYTLYDKYGIKGDKALAFRCDLVCKYEYPLFEGEKFGGDAYVFNKMNDEYPMVLLREKIIGHGEGEDSITSNLLTHHLKSPNGMREHYKDTLAHEHYNKWNIIKHCIGYISYSLITRKKLNEIVRSSPHKMCTFFMLPVGVAYYWRLVIARRRLLF